MKDLLSFYENLVEEEYVDKIKKDFIKQYFEHNSSPYKIDENGDIWEASEEVAYSFKTHLKRINNNEFNSFKEKIRFAYYNSSDKIKFKRSLTERINDLKQISQKTYKDEYDYIFQFYLDLENYLYKRFNTGDKPIEFNKKSYKWDNFDLQYAEKQIETLFIGLCKLNYSHIDDKTDFINGFTGKEVLNGVRWLPKNDRNQALKPQLFNLIDSLMENYVNTKNGKSYNDAILYVFRKFDGDKFSISSIKTSKSTNTSCIDNEIETLIDSLSEIP